MKTVTFSENAYEIVSHGNGWAFAVLDTAANRTFWVQDDSAAQFRDECLVFGWERTCRDYMDLIGKAVG
jgi:hypothetical protein